MVMNPPTPARPSLPTSQHIPQRTIDGDETIALGSLVLVASRSKPGFWYPVADGHCPCTGHKYRHTCRHRIVAALIAYAAHPPGFRD
jgi:hypothetical protein